MTHSENSRATAGWSSTAGFFLAATGTAVGLGNVWRFPFLAGENGGGAFVVVYLIAVLMIGLPLMMAELAIGRKGRAAGDQAVRNLSGEVGASPWWGSIGWLSFIIPFVGIGYYSVVGGWVSDYFAMAFVNRADAGSEFNDMLADPVRLLVGQTVFLSLVTYVVTKDIRQGIERIAKFMMPAFFLLLLGLAIYAAVVGDFARAVDFLLAPDFSALSTKVVMLAVGQAFFSLAIGIGVMMAFGSYLPSNVSLFRTAGGICLADTLVAIIAGMMIFPLLFAQGLDPQSGPGLVFITMPGAFDAMTGGAVLYFLFFALLFLAAFTTGVGTLEAAAAWLINRGVARPKAAIWCGIGAWFIALITMLSFNILSSVRPLEFIAMFAESSIFDVIDLTIANLLLPLNGLLVALFAGWAMKNNTLIREISPAGVYRIWHGIIRFLVPLGLISVLISLWG